jgi:hypothetical protein
MLACHGCRAFLVALGPLTVSLGACWRLPRNRRTSASRGGMVACSMPDRSQTSVTAASGVAALCSLIVAISAYRHAAPGTARKSGRVVILMAYGILRAQLFDIDLRLTSGLRRGAIAAIVMFAFLTTVKLAEQFISEELGYLIGAFHGSRPCICAQARRTLCRVVFRARCCPAWRCRPRT